MEQYIKKSDIVAEIERLKKEECPTDTYEGRCKLFWFEQFLSFINTLEVKDEVLDRNDKTKLMKKCVHKAYKRGYDMGVLQTTNKMKHNAKEADLDKELFDWYNKEKNTDYNASILYEKYNNTLKKLVKHFFKN